MVCFVFTYKIFFDKKIKWDSLEVYRKKILSNKFGITFANGAK